MAISLVETLGKEPKVLPKKNEKKFENIIANMDTAQKNIPNIKNNIESKNS